MLHNRNSPLPERKFPRTHPRVGGEFRGAAAESAPIPWALMTAAAALTLCGWMAIARGESLTGGLPTAQQQAVWGLLAAGAGVVAGSVRPGRWQRWSYGLLLVAVVALAAVYLFPPINGARRWIRWGPIGVQPSEFAKVAFVLALARWLAARQHLNRFWPLCPALLATGLCMLLVLGEPDLGTALVFVPVMLAMFYAAGVRPRYLVLLLVCGGLLVPVVWRQMNHEQRSRVTAWLRQPVPGEAASADNYQLQQARQAMALGGVWGTWLAGEPEVDRLCWHVPADRTDFVFAILGERFGWWGLGTVLALYALLVDRMLRIALATRDPFARLVGVGLAALVAVPSLINTGMIVGLLPITGISLPLVSYGGSGLLAQGVALGIICAIARHPGHGLSSEPFRPLAFHPNAASLP